MPKDRPYHYCIMQVGKDPKIIEVQGLTWFATEDLAYQYWGFMNEEFQNSIGAISVISEENLPYFFDCNSEYIKKKLTGTRLTKPEDDGPGVVVSTTGVTIGTSLDEDI
jgi:hypothetical protein